MASQCQTLPRLCSSVWRAVESGIADESRQDDIATNQQRWAVSTQGMMESSKLIYPQAIHLPCPALQPINPWSHPTGPGVSLSKSPTAAQGPSSTGTGQGMSRVLEAAASSSLPPHLELFSSPSPAHARLGAGMEPGTAGAQLQGEDSCSFYCCGVAGGKPQSSRNARGGYPGAQGLSHSLLAPFPSAEQLPAPARHEAQLGLPGCIKPSPLRGLLCTELRIRV